MIAFREIFDRFDRFFNLGKEAVGEKRTSFPFVIIESRTQISVKKPMIGDAWHLPPEFRLDFLPGSTCRWIAFHFINPPAGLFGTIIGIG